MSTIFSRRSGSRHSRAIVPPRMGHFYLNAVDRRLFCLNEMSRQLLREGLPISPSDLQRQPLLHLDGSLVRASELPLLLAWEKRTPYEATFLWPTNGDLPWVLSWSAAPLQGGDNLMVGVALSVVVVPHDPDWEELAGMAHDLRTPLQALRLLTPLTQSRGETDSPSDLFLRLRGATDRALAIAEDLLAWCKAPVQAQQPPPREWVPLAPFLHGLVLEQEMSARAKQINLQSDLSALQRVEMFTSRIALGRLIGNLLTNAVRYTSAGRVRLLASWRVEQGSKADLRLAVEDTGIGLTDEEQESIFHPFQRGRAGWADPDSGGSGIGLATVDRLVSELGLALEITSEPGRGSRFELLVPPEQLRILPT